MSNKQNDKILDAIMDLEPMTRRVALRLKFELYDNTTLYGLQRGVRSVVEYLEKELDKGIEIT